MDIKDTRDMRVVIEKAVSKNLPDIARWLAKTQGYLFRACTGTAALRGSNKKAVKREKTNRIFSLSGKFSGLTTLRNGMTKLFFVWLQILLHNWT